jgi:hypothetical protein
MVAARPMMLTIVAGNTPELASFSPEVEGETKVMKTANQHVTKGKVSCDDYPAGLHRRKTDWWWQAINRKYFE